MTRIEMIDKSSEIVNEIIEKISNDEIDPKSTIYILEYIQGWATESLKSLKA